ncbi:MAG TPA: glycosyltransferase family 39 protein, partial [Polyangia bacterium]|nr:glycosyltransferase family 39 protein [Polyangia bacterium]
MDGARSGTAARVTWMRSRMPELLVLLIAATLRAVFVHQYDYTWGYDFPDHRVYIDWFQDHLRLPPPLPDLMISKEAYHPPLFYLLAASLLRMGGSYDGLQRLMALMGLMRLALIWYGLERYVPSRAARILGLILAAILPAAVHLDGMVYGESLNALLAVVSLLLLMRFLEMSDGRWKVGALLGVALGLGVLTKLSGLILLAVAGAGIAIDLSWWTGPARDRLRRLAPASAVLVALLAVAGPHHVASYRARHKVFLTGWDGPDGHQLRSSQIEKTPYLDRRTLGYFAGWSNDIFQSPYWPSGTLPHPRFWPVLVASTFVDYYNYRFGYRPDPGEPTIKLNEMPLALSVLEASRASVAGGMMIVATTVLAWSGLARWVWRRRRAELAAALLLPALAVA